MLQRLILFLILNFGALALGSIFTSKGVPSDWYTNLNKAPWTPPGWMFGFAWTTIMICFTFFMAYAVKETKKLKSLIILFSLQWVLNVTWNPVFFYFQNPLAGLLIITSLTLLVGFLLYQHLHILKLKSLYIAPYFLWLLIATSLNAYVLFNN